MCALESTWKIYCCSFSSLFSDFCVKRPNSVFRDVWTVILFVRTVILVVRRYGWFVRTLLVLVWTAVFLRSLTWHHVWTSLMFRPEGEPCRVKSHSPYAARHFLLSCCDFLSFCAFSLWFVCIILTCTCHICSLSPPQVYSCTLLLFILSFLCLK